MEILKDVKKGRLHSAYVFGPFDKAKEKLEEDGYRIISLEENARLRVREGPNSSISRMGNWTREGFIYIPGKGHFLTRNSPILGNIEKAIEWQGNGNSFYLTNERAERMLSDSVRVRETIIPTKRFSENELTSFAFGKSAQDYGDFLRENKIKNISIELLAPSNSAFATQTWFSNIGRICRSSINGQGIKYATGDTRGVCEIVYKSRDLAKRTDKMRMKRSIRTRSRF